VASDGFSLFLTRTGVDDGRTLGAIFRPVAEVAALSIPASSMVFLNATKTRVQDGRAEAKRISGNIAMGSRGDNAKGAVAFGRWAGELIEGSSHLICLCREGRIEHLNPAGAGALGLACPEDGGGLALADFFEGESGDALGKLVNCRYVAAGRMQGTLMPRDGDTRKVDVEVIPIGEKEAHTAVVEVHDIVDSARQLAVLRDSERRFRDLVECSSDWVWAIDQDCVYTYVSPKVRDILGYEVEEVLGREPFDLMPAAEAERVRREFTPYLEDPRPFANLENVNLHKDRRLIVLETSGVPIFSPAGTFRGYRGIDRDITERKRTHEEIRQNLVNLDIIATILRLSLQPISLDDLLKQALSLVLSSPNLGLLSQGCIFLVGESPGELELKAQTGLPPSLLESCRRLPFGRCLCGQAAQSGKTIFADRVDERHEIIYPAMAPHGHYCVPIQSDGEVLGVINLYVPEGHEHLRAEERFLSSVADTLAGVIRRRLAEDELRRHDLERQFSKLSGEYHRVIQMEKLSAMGMMVGEIAHQINNPLVGVLNMAQLAEREADDPARTRELLGEITAAGEHCRTFLQRMLEFTSISRSDRKPTDMNTLIAGTISLFQQSAGNAHPLVTDLPDEAVTLKVDPVLIRHALFNLLSNAVQASRPGGTVIVCLTPEIAHDEGTAGWSLSVIDHGEGIPDDIVGKIFTPFFSTRSNGTGLGLPVVQHVAILHEGHVSAANMPEGGACFAIWLPSGECGDWT
jgi:PAS domain S-box-containing protein